MKFYFTFGSSQRTARGEGLLNKFVCLEGGFAETRAAMHEARGPKWAFQYSETEFAGQPEKYGLVEVPLEYVTL